jgi:hypothetical protein
MAHGTLKSAYLSIAVIVGLWTFVTTSADKACIARLADAGGISALSEGQNSVTYSLIRGLAWPVGLVGLTPLKDLEPLKSIVDLLNKDHRKC